MDFQKLLLTNYKTSKINAAARVIVGVRKREHNTAVLKQLHWLSVELRIIFKVNLLTYKCLHHLAPTYLQELRSSSAVLRLKPVSGSLKNYGLRAFSVHAPDLSNQLPDTVREAETVSVFKSRLKTHLFKNYFNDVTFFLASSIYYQSCYYFKKFFLYS